MRTDTFDIWKNHFTCLSIKGKKGDVRVIEVRVIESPL